ncbi:MAG: ABC transporter permease subunit [Burkholderiales bacterium]|nr:ABC transporter permease subunit [Burkholderiales bacterium]
MRRVLLGAFIPLLALAAWELLGRLGLLSADSFSRPSLVFPAALRVLADGSLLKQTGETFAAAIVGLAIAAVAGVGCGAPLGLFRPLERIATLTIEVLRPVPSVALIPVALLTFGFSQNMTVSVVAFACFWPILIVTISAVRGIDPRLIEVGRMVGFPPVARIRKLALPAALPVIMVGVRIAAGIAIVVAVTVEIAANPRGLGFGMIVAQQSLNADVMWATLIWLGLVGWLANWGLLRLERRWLRWFWAGREGS